MDLGILLGGNGFRRKEKVAKTMDRIVKAYDIINITAETHDGQTRITGTVHIILDSYLMADRLIVQAVSPNGSVRDIVLWVSVRGDKMMAPKEWNVPFTFNLPETLETVNVRAVIERTLKNAGHIQVNKNVQVSTPETLPVYSSNSVSVTA